MEEDFFRVRITCDGGNFDDEERVLTGSLRRRFPTGNNEVFCRVISIDD